MRIHLTYRFREVGSGQWAVGSFSSLSTVHYTLPTIIIGENHALEEHLHYAFTITRLFGNYRYGSRESFFRQMGHHRRRPAQQSRLLARSEGGGRQAHGQLPQSAGKRAAAG